MRVYASQLPIPATIPLSNHTPMLCNLSAVFSSLLEASSALLDEIVATLADFSTVDAANSSLSVQYFSLSTNTFIAGSWVAELGLVCALENLRLKF